MKSRAAVLFEAGQKLEIREVDVQDPGPGEVRIQMVAGVSQHCTLKPCDLHRPELHRPFS